MVLEIRVLLRFPVNTGISSLRTLCNTIHCISFDMNTSRLAERLVSFVLGFRGRLTAGAQYTVRYTFIVRAYSSTKTTGASQPLIKQTSTRARMHGRQVVIKPFDSREIVSAVSIPAYSFRHSQSYSTITILFITLDQTTMDPPRCNLPWGLSDSPSIEVLFADGNQTKGLGPAEAKAFYEEFRSHWEDSEAPEILLQGLAHHNKDFKISKAIVLGLGSIAGTCYPYENVQAWRYAVTTHAAACRVSPCC